MSKRKKIKAEDKIRIAKECVYGSLSQSAAAEHAGVDVTVVMDWVRLYQSEGVQAFLPREEKLAVMIEEAKKQIAAENEKLKATNQ